MDNLTNELKLYETEMGKFLNGNSSSGTKARKALQNIKNLCQHLRQDILLEQKKRKQAKKEAKVEPVAVATVPVEVKELVEEVGEPPLSPKKKKKKRKTKSKE